MGNSTTQLYSGNPAQRSLLRIWVCEPKEVTFKDPSGVWRKGLYGHHLDIRVLRLGLSSCGQDNRASLKALVASVRVCLEQVSSTINRALVASVRVLWVQVPKPEYPPEAPSTIRCQWVYRPGQGKRLKHTERKSATIWCQRTTVWNHYFELAVSISTPKLPYYYPYNSRCRESTRHTFL